MTVAPTTFIEADAGLDEVAQKVTEIIASVRTAIARINAADVAMDQIALAAPTGYLSLIQYITAQAAANPSNAAWVALAARKDNIVADFATVNAYIDDLVAATD